MVKKYHKDNYFIRRISYYSRWRGRGLILNHKINQTGLKDECIRRVIGPHVPIKLKGKSYRISIRPHYSMKQSVGLLQKDTNKQTANGQMDVR